eukprot:TRINITY_DN4947_c0_g1_i7.p1 TRINITY_DN4947_c0_g1~~TRINITY_DN4947_c0_g1_i7.p1  ORF type:complete len:216 (+),score=27.68 TRINITY_DN4947_c0_g1_i7:83-649(+)
MCIRDRYQPYGYPPINYVELFNNNPMVRRDNVAEDPYFQLLNHSMRQFSQLMMNTSYNRNYGYNQCNPQTQYMNALPVNAFTHGPANIVQPVNQAPVNDYRKMMIGSKRSAPLDQELMLDGQDVLTKKRFTVETTGTKQVYFNESSSPTFTKSSQNHLRNSMCSFFSLSPSLESHFPYFSIKEKMCRY